MSDIDYSYIKNIMHEINKNSHIKIEDIPEYKLYISQVEELFEMKLGNIDNIDDDKKVLSKTMIQNYIKDGLVMPPEGKSYNKNHIILLIFIYNLKSILAIKDIKKLLFPIIDIAKSDEQDCGKIELIYTDYTQIREKFIDENIENFMKNIKDVHDELYDSLGKEGFMRDWTENMDILLIIFLLVMQADIYKKTAEYLIDRYLSEGE